MSAFLAALLPHTPEVQRATLVELLRRQFKASLFATTKHLLGYRDVNWRTHGDVFRALEAPTRRKLIVMPRGTFKSSICSVAYPIWLLLRNPDLRILIDSELYTNSKNFLREISGHLLGREVPPLFGDFRGSTWNEGEMLIAQRAKIAKEASLTASGIGAGKTSQHFDVIICDDLNSPDNSSTIEMRQKVVAHYRYNQAILEPEGTLVVVGTRYSADDVPGMILRNEVADGD